MTANLDPAFRELLEFIKLFALSQAAQQARDASLLKRTAFSSRITEVYSEEV